MNAWTRNWLDHGAHAESYAEQAEDQARAQGVEPRPHEELLEEARRIAQQYEGDDN